MSDNQQDRGRSRDRIDVHDQGQCRYWSRYFGVRPKDLKHAVREVGNRAADVEKHFDIHRPQMPVGVPDMGTVD